MMCLKNTGKELEINMNYEIQISSNKDTLWIHASDGSTVGRFSRFGIDMHNTVTEQMQGSAQCRLCTHKQPTRSDWKLFIEKALEFWGVVVPPGAFNNSFLK